MIANMAGCSASADGTGNAEKSGTSAVSEVSGRTDVPDTSESRPAEDRPDTESRPAEDHSGTEGKALEGKPWPNSDLYENLPSERPGPEESFDLYANYDVYQDALAREDKKEINALDLADIAARDQVLGLCRDQECTDAESEILRIMYGLLTDTEKRDRDGLAPLLARVERGKGSENCRGADRSDAGRWLPDEHAFFRGDGSAVAVKP